MIKKYNYFLVLDILQGIHILKMTLIFVRIFWEYQFVFEAGLYYRKIQIYIMI